ATKPPPPYAKPSPGATAPASSPPAAHPRPDATSTTTPPGPTAPPTPPTSTTSADDTTNSKPTDSSPPETRRRAIVITPWKTGNRDRKSTRLNSSHVSISYAVFCLKKKIIHRRNRSRLYFDITWR